MSEQGVAIIGSCNMDLVCYVDRFPKEGETLIANSYEKNCGGKGNNIAVMAAKLSEEGKTIFVSAVGLFWEYRNFLYKSLGDDSEGTTMLNNCKKQGIKDVEKHIRVMKDRTSGVAFIIVDKNGKNSNYINI
jgi:ribokinase